MFFIFTIKPFIMNRSLILTVAIIVTTLSASFAQFAADGSEIFKIAAADAARNRKKPPANSKLGDNYDLKYHRLSLNIDPDTLYLSGAVTSYFQITQTAASQISFELISQMMVDSVIFQGIPVAFSHNNDELQISLGLSIPAGQLDSVTVYYHGVPSAGVGFGSFIKDVHNGIPVVWTLSEPYGAKDWWPCKNSLSDKIDSLDVIVTTPAAYRCASNGLLINEYTAGANKVYHWKHRYPIATYLVAIAVTNYAVYSDWVPLGSDTLEILNYVFPEDLATAQAGTAGLVPVMQLFDSLFTPYPFMLEKYGHAQFKWGGGMEHQTMTFLVNFGHELMSHELAHQWFGDMVTCGSWQDIWVNEGFATYVTGLTAQYMFGGYWWPLWKKQRVQSITSQPDGSVYCYDTTSVARIFNGRLSYEKGAMVLHMLRWKVGDTAFYSAMRNFLSDPVLMHGFAKTSDVQYHFEYASGQNLNSFFQNWVYNEGHPIYSVNCVTHPDSSIDVTIFQASSHSSVPFFEMPVPIRFKNNIRDTIIVFDHNASGQSFNVNTGFVPDSVFFDPDTWLVAVLDTLIITSIDEKNSQPLSVYPNPSKSQINISAGNQEIVSLLLTDIRGRRLMLWQPATPTSSLTINHELAPGIYFLKAVSRQNILTSKFVVE